MALKVFHGCFDGVTEWIVAATSQKKAAEAFDISLYIMRQYGSDGSSDEAESIALAEPGVVFSVPCTTRGVPYARGRHVARRGQPWPPEGVDVVTPPNA
jgi:hypothetical protein